jgi:hypothetical protein
MNTIEIKINHTALSSLCFALEIQTFAGSYTPEQKIVMSIMHDLSKKLQKKEIDKRGNNSKFKISFKYHEAFGLERFCRELYVSFKEDTYLAHNALNIANQIHEQL